MAVTNWRGYLLGLAPTFLKGYWGTRFLESIGLLADLYSEGAAEALKAPWLLEPTSPDDALRYIGAERRMPRYPGESSATYRTRLYGAWDAYEYAGVDSSIIGQLAAAGYSGAAIVTDDSAPGPRGEAAPYWSQFWVSIPGLSTTKPTWGSFAWGSGTAWGTSVSPAVVATLRAIVNRWKPPDWAFRGLIFDAGTEAVWGSFAWGDGTLWSGGLIVSNGFS